MAISVIDLFCGAGGLSYGMHMAGADVVAGFDNDKSALESFAFNHNGSQAVYADLSNPIQNLSRFTGVDFVVGGPPCQGFSISGKRDPDDVRNQLYQIYFDTLKKLNPKIFILENVPNMISMQNGYFRDRVVTELEALGYKVTFKILTASDFGIPQKRRRVFFVGCKERYFEIRENKDCYAEVSCSDAISDLLDFSLEDGSPYPSEAESAYQEVMRRNSKGVWNHILTNHTEKTTKIISMVPDGGNYKDLPVEFRDTRKVNIAWTRLDSKKPSFTIDTGHRHHFHYLYDRIPTVRESARLQSFPDEFLFRGTKTNQYKQVGNAVPPLLAKEIFLQICEAEF